MELKKYLILIIVCLSVVINACSPGLSFKRDAAIFQSSKIVSTYKAFADMNDAYFVIRENNFFEFYRELFDSLKNTSYPGKYTKNGDTLYLQFYNNKGSSILGNKALINNERKEIIFFDNYTGVKKKLLFN